MEMYPALVSVLALLLGRGLARAGLEPLDRELRAGLGRIES